MSEYFPFTLSAKYLLDMAVWMGLLFLFDHCYDRSKIKQSRKWPCIQQNYTTFYNDITCNMFNACVIHKNVNVTYSHSAEHSLSYVFPFIPHTGRYMNGQAHAFWQGHCPSHSTVWELKQNSFIIL